MPKHLRPQLFSKHLLSDQICVSCNNKYHLLLQYNIYNVQKHVTWKIKKWYSMLQKHITRKMQTKTLVQIVFLAAILASNYLLVLEYQEEYVPDNFDIRKLLHQKYRCIRYFNDKEHNKYLHQKCSDYAYDYTEFVLERSRYIYMFYVYNFVISGLFGLFHFILMWKNR